jgi:hypothetical protein
VIEHLTDHLPPPSSASTPSSPAGIAGILALPRSAAVETPASSAASDSDELHTTLAGIVKIFTTVAQ